MDYLVTDAGLLNSLAAHLELRLILFCFTPRSDSIWHQEDFSSAGGDGLTVSFAFLPRPRILEMLRGDQLDSMTLINCDSVENPGDIPAEKMFAKHIVWLVPAAAADGLGAADLRLDSNVLSMTRSLDGNVVDLTEAYAAKRASLLRTRFGIYTPASGLVVPVPSKWDRRSNLQGVEIVDGMLPVPQFIIEGPGGGLENATGFMVELVRTLAAFGNFTVRRIMPPDNAYGSLVEREDGTLEYNGLVGMLARGEIDLSSGGLTHTKERDEAIDFTVGVLLDFITIVMASPSSAGGARYDANSSVNFLAYVSVFPLTAWWSLLASVVITGLAHMFFAERLGRRRWWSSGRFGEGVAMGGRMLIQLDSGLRPSSLPSKVLLMTVGLAGFLMFAMYTSDLTALLTATRPLGSLRSFQDVLDNEFKLIFPPDSVFESLLAQYDENSAAGKVYQITKDNDYYGVRSTESIFADLAALLKSSPKYLCFVTPFGFLGDDDIIHLTHFEDAFPSHIPLGVQPDSELTGLVNHLLGKMRQTGVMSHLLDTWVYPARTGLGKYADVENNEAFPLGLGNLYFPGSAIVLGSAAALAIVLAERQVHRPLGGLDTANLRRAIRDNIYGSHFQ